MCELRTQATGTETLSSHWLNEEQYGINGSSAINRDGSLVTSQVMPKIKETKSPSPQCNQLDPLGFEPGAFRMQSGCDTTTPRAHMMWLGCQHLRDTSLHAAMDAVNHHSCSQQLKEVGLMKCV